ncbi:hypothetical protein SSX86_008014 [Deinandra increscens subsp. villosa]|uniref:Synergin gamma C-terminal domain-containing protein n=1 Tax=Deinandra increscens subsp. villosa TaxID=3103831 RepID=A0AAP0DBS8_9ASTR
MADNDEDDDSFGEFTFAPIQTTVNSSSQIPATTGDDDDWGNFNLFQNNAPNHNLNPPPPPPQTQTQPKWEKFRGALPLSIFGDEEDQADTDEKSVTPVVRDDVKQSSFSGSSGFASGNNNSHKSNAHMGINDLIANLYGQKQQQQEEKSVKADDNGNELDFSAMNSTVSKDPLSKSNSLGSVDTVLAAAAGDQGSDDEGGWEFIDAFSDSKLAHSEKDHKELSEKTVSSPGLRSGSHGPTDLFAAPNNGFFVESRVAENGFDSKPITIFQDGFSAGLKLDSKGTANELGSKPLGGSDDFDDTFGEFETAFMEHPSGKKESYEERFDPLGSHDTSRRSVDLFSSSNGVPGGPHMESNGFDFSQIRVVENGFASDPFSQTEWKETKDDSDSQPPDVGSHDTSHRSVDLFSSSNGVPGGPHMESNGFDFSQIRVVENGFASDLFSQTEWKETKDDSDSQPPDVGADEESFGKFETGFQESESKPQGFEASTKKYKEAVPLSIFGIEEDPEADNSLNIEHEFFKSSTNGKHTRNLSSNLSINDILSDLYSQAQPISSDGKEDLLHSTDNEYGSHVADDKDDDNNNDDDFNDGSWEFKDASFQSKIENENSFKKKLNNFMDLYSNLKDDLCVVARRTSSQFKAQSTTTLAGEEMKVAALSKEIEEAMEKLHQKDIISTEMHLDNHPERVLSLEKYIEIFQEPDYQVLESEYNISRRLLLAESDLPTAIDLINHFTTVLKILEIAPKCEPADYVSLWLKVILVCSQELNHGSSIWKQSLEKNVHNEILSDKQGRQFIISLGEIYRAVMILETAVKFYKPWILLSGADIEGFYGLVEECHSVWSTSGLEESIPADYLLESIRHIQNLDEIAVVNQIRSQEESQCGLSLLSPGVVPEMKMVTWNEDKYFVTLANLWANLISHDPPKLSIRVG